MPGEAPIGGKMVRLSMAAWMRSLWTLVAGLTLATAAHAQQLHPGGAVTCPGGFTAYRLNGEGVIMCPPPALTPEQARAWRLEQQRIWDAEQQRLRDMYAQPGACGPDVPQFRRSPNCP